VCAREKEAVRSREKEKKLEIIEYSLYFSDLKIKFFLMNGLSIYCNE